MEPEQVRKEARKRVDAKLRFRKHFRTYLFVVAVLAVINIFTSSYPWVFWVIFGWGIALGLEAWRVHGPREDPGLRERMIEEETQKLSSEDGSPGT